MAKPSGFAVAMKDANDTITYVLPAERFSKLAQNATLSLALKVYVGGSGQGKGEPIGWGHLQPGNPFGGDVLAGGTGAAADETAPADETSAETSGVTSVETVGVTAAETADEASGVTVTSAVSAAAGGASAVADGAAADDCPIAP